MKKFLAAALVGGALGAAIFAVHPAPQDYFAYRIASEGFLESNWYEATRDDYARIAGMRGIVAWEYPYYYPLLTAAFALPLVPLAPDVGAAIWAICSGMALGIAAYALMPRRAVAWVAAVAFLPLAVTLYAGQVNAFVVLFLALAVRWLLDGRERGAGFALAVATLLKPFSLPVVGLLVWRREWKALQGFALGLAVILGACLAIFGVESSLAQVAAVRGPLEAAVNLYGANQSVVAAIGRLGLPEAVSLGIRILLCAIALFLIIPPGRRDRGTVAREIGLTLILTLLIAPLAWYHHYAVLLVPAALLLRRDLRDPLAWIGSGLIAIHAVAWKLLPYPPFSELALIGALVLFAAVARAGRGAVSSAHG